MPGFRKECSYKILFGSSKNCASFREILGNVSRCFFMASEIRLKLYYTTSLAIEYRTMLSLLAQSIASYFNAKPEMNSLIIFFLFFITLVTLMQQKHRGLMFLFF